MSVCRRRGGRPKLAHATREAALAYVGPGENAYRCTRCGAWHVGHDTAQGKRRLLKKFSHKWRRKQRKIGAYS